MSEYITAEELSQDQKTIAPKWRALKYQTYKLSRLYELAGYHKLALDAAGCSTYISFAPGKDGDKRLIYANSCKTRLCTLCGERRAHKKAAELSRVMSLIQLERPTQRYVFLTLTVANCAGTALHDTLLHLTRAWKKLTDKQRFFNQSVDGWFRAIEITYNAQDRTYHPHIHAILAVKNGYFDRQTDLYIPQPKWVDAWAKALDVTYKPLVSIEAVKASASPDAAETDAASGLAAAKEAAKYTVKSKDYLKTGYRTEAAQIVKDYTEGLQRVRLTAYGGIMRDAAGEVDDEDLRDREQLRADIAQLQLQYHWSFGARDYIFDYALRGDDAAALLDKPETDPGYTIEAAAIAAQTTIEGYDLSTRPTHPI